MSTKSVSQETAELPLPGAFLPSAKMPGHWLLARLGKRVLRPGGIEATRKLLSALNVSKRDDVVEFAPGLGITARMTLRRSPNSYTAIERDEEAAARTRIYLAGPSRRCLVATAQNTSLPDGYASVVYGEAMLTMQADDQKAQIIREASRILRPGGSYGIHELALVPDDLAPTIRNNIYRDLAAAIHVNARPLTPNEWAGQLTECGFEIKSRDTVPMRLLEPSRALRDEGPFRFAKILFNLMRDTEARERVFQMRTIFRKYSHHLAAIVLVGKK